MRSITALFTNPTLRAAALVLYYLAILVALAVMYGQGDFSDPSFIYQGY
jgi:hypothetical protein